MRAMRVVAAEAPSGARGPLACCGQRACACVVATVLLVFILAGIVAYQGPQGDLLPPQLKRWVWDDETLELALEEADMDGTEAEYEAVTEAIEGSSQSSDGSTMDSDADDKKLRGGPKDEYEKKPGAGKTVHVASASSPEAPRDQVPECHAAQYRKLRPGEKTTARLQYIHVPKAGGTSIQYALEKWAKDEGLSVAMWNGPALGDSSTVCRKDVAGATVLMGHRGFGYCQDVVKQPQTYYTTALREPISRVLSLYLYQKEQRGLGKFKAAFPPSRNLSDLIVEFKQTTNIIEDGERLLKYACSQQTRFICGFECLGPAGKSLKVPEMLAKAKENIYKIHSLGIVEQLNQLLLQLKTHVHWIPRKIGAWPVWNKRHVKPVTLSEEARGILSEWCEADAELYSIAKEISAQKTAEAKACLRGMHEKRLAAGGRSQRQKQPKREEEEGEETAEGAGRA